MKRRTVWLSGVLLLAGCYDLRGTPGTDAGSDAGGDAGTPLDSVDAGESVDAVDAAGMDVAGSDVVDAGESIDASIDADVPQDVVEDHSAPVDAAEDGGDAAEASVDTGIAACAAGELRCGDTCVQPQTDPAHCGACGNRCALSNATATCMDGACRVLACTEGFADCDGTAANGCEQPTRSDNAHCGACRNACTQGRLCVEGVCACPSGQTFCTEAMACLNQQRDNNHCGACGNACTGGQSCQSGVCACPTGQTLCNGACVNTGNDLAHCGVCGNRCAAGQVCAAGLCDTVCPAGQTNCAGTCRDTQADSNHCGTCGTACTGGRTCQAGLCACPTGQTLCTLSGVGTCRTLAGDPSNCGGCGRTCTAPSGGSVTCMSGTCVQVCPSGQQNCGGVCRPSGACTSEGTGGCQGTGTIVCTGTSALCNAVPRTSGSCTSPINGVCTVGGLCTCPAGQTNCAGTCRSLTSDVDSCGTCTTVCPSVINGVRTCTSATCGIACNAGYSASGGACVPAQRSCTAPTAVGCGRVLIEPLTFTMGGDSVAHNASIAQTNVSVSRFYLDAYPVTMARFRRFWEAGDRPTGPFTVPYRANGTTVQVSVGAPQAADTGQNCNWGVAGRDNHPINCVDWHTAMAFCVWDGGRLATEAEWERAARPDGTAQLPWGGTTQDPARICSSLGGSRSSTCAVDDPAFIAGAAAHGGQRVYHLVGNVWEWAADNWSEYSTTGAAAPCTNRSSLENPICTGSGGDSLRRVPRGGSWFNTDPANLRSSTRDSVRATDRYYLYGIRCARDYP